MPHIAGHDRSQTLLLPEALDDYVAQDNPVRFIAFWANNRRYLAGISRMSIRDHRRIGTELGVQQ